MRAAQGEVVLEDGARLSAGRIVIATGTDIRLCPWLNVQPRKGHLVITDRYPGAVRHQLVELGYLKSASNLDTDSVAFNLQPRKTGQLLIGSSRQYGDLSSNADAEMLRKMLDRAVEYMPALRSLSVVRVWTGFRAATPDKLPIIGPTPDESVLVAMGFEGVGNYERSWRGAAGAASSDRSGCADRSRAVSSRPHSKQRGALCLTKTECPQLR